MNNLNNNEKQSAKKASKKSLTDRLNIEPIKAKYIGKGVIRLYCEPDENPELDEIHESLSKLSISKPSTSSSSSASSSESSSSSEENKNIIVSILAIPSYFTATDVLGFVGDEYTQSHISNVRLIKSDTNNRFLALLNFRDIKYAKKFKKEFNGKHFNSMEPETCQCIYVKSVIFKKHGVSDNNYFVEDPFTTTNDNYDMVTSFDKPLPPPTPNIQELPTCPVCLERMDSSTTGLLTIPCQHTFHCQCLSKWQDDSCPICRYSSQKQHVKNLRTASTSLMDNQEDDECNICGIKENLWICLICGNIACGRYNQAHAITHFTETGHCFSMDINSQRIWDYATDSYVHRLLATEDEGKLVELPSREEFSTTGTTGDSSSKIEKGSRDAYVEYSDILRTQLESQREYYELKLSEMSDFMDTKERLLKDFSKKTENRIKGTVDQFQSKLEFLETESKRAIDRANKLYEDEKAMSSGLMEKIKSLENKNEQLKKQLEQKDVEKADLQEQINDLMFYLETQNKFKDAPDDVKEGALVLKPKEQPKASTSKKKKKVKLLPPKEMKIKKEEKK